MDKDVTQGAAGKGRPSVGNLTETLDASDGRSLTPRSEPSDVELLGPEMALQRPLATASDDRYAFVGEHARGGLGRVVKAHDRQLGRTVAIKELLRHSDGAESRFVCEALVTARLQHPGIVPVHETGRWPTGEPFYVMKLVSGRSLKELVRDKKALQERLSLLPQVIAVVDAIAYAHSECVIHRDLKPANVVVGDFGETVVVDWGLAQDRKLADTADTAEQNSPGKVVGTPAYMPPEQARGEKVDERADVYSLGALLYEVLAGKAPYVGEDSDEILGTVLAGPPPPVDQVQAGVPRDLVAIVNKAMARDIGCRYPTAKELSDDLRRFETGHLVSAYRYSRTHLFGRWTWRHRGAVGMAVAGLTVAAVLSVLGVQEIVAERNVAKAERNAAHKARLSAEVRRNELLFLQAETSLHRDPTATLAWLKDYPIDGPRADAVQGLIENARSLGVARHIFRDHKDWVFDVAFSPDGTTLASISKDRTVRLWNLRTSTNKVLGTLDFGGERIAYSPDGKLLATGGRNGVIHLWTIATGTSRRVFAHRGMVMAMRFSEDGRRFMSASETGHALVWDLEKQQTVFETKGDGAKAIALSATGSQVAVYRDGGIYLHSGATESHKIVDVAGSPDAMDFSPDSSHLAFHVPGGLVRVVELKTNKIRELGEHPDHVSSIVFTRDHRFVATAGDDKIVRLWNVAGGGVRLLRGHEDAIYQVAFSADGQLIASAGDDGTSRVWNLQTREVHVLRGHRDDVYRVAISPDGQSIATASLDTDVRVWPSRFDDARVLLGHKAGVGHVVFGNGGRTLISHGFDADLRVWNVSEGTSHTIGHSGQVNVKRLRRPIVSEDGTLVVSIRDRKTIDLWNVEDGKRHTLRLPSGKLTGVGLDTARAVIFTSASDGHVLSWDIATRLSSPFVTEPSTGGLAVSAEGSRLAVATGAGIRIFATDSKKIITVLSCNGDCETASMNRMIFSADGHWLASPLRGGPVMLWNVASGELHRLDVDGFTIVDLTFSPDGSRLAAAIADRTVRVWQVNDQSERVLPGHRDLVHRVVFSPDGAMLASASYDKTIRLWDMDTGIASVLRGHAASVDGVAFSPDGKMLASAGRDSTVRLWDVSHRRAQEPHTVRSIMESTTTAAICEDNRPGVVP